MSAVDEHAEAHRLKTELGYGARRIAGRLGISRYAAEQFLDRPLPGPAADASGEPVADEVAAPVGQERPLAEVAEPVAVQVADEARPVAGVADRPLTAVGHAAGAADGALVGPLLVIDLGRFPGLAEDLAVLQGTGATAEEAVNYAAAALAQAYRNALAAGRLRPGQVFDVVEMRLRAGPRPERRTA